MNEERLNRLFQEIREEKPSTSVHEVSKWIALSAASAGIFGLLAQFKLPVLFTKKLIVMTSIIASVGIGATALFLSASTPKENTKSSPNEARPTAVTSIASPRETKPAIAPKETQDVRLPDSISESTIELKPHTLENLTVSIPIEQPTSPVQKDRLPVFVSRRNGTEIKVDFFNQVHASSALDIVVSQGEKQSITVEGTDVDTETIDVKVKRGELHIKQKNRSVSNDQKFTIYITMTEITGFGVSGAASIRSSMELDAPEIDVQGTGAGDLELELKSTYVKIEGTGAAHISLKGTASSVVMEATGASSIDCYKLKADTLDVVAAGAASVECTAQEKLSINATGASHVCYKGSPETISKYASTAAKISKRI